MSESLLRELDRVGSGVSFLLSFSSLSGPLAERLPQLVSSGEFWRALKQADLERAEPFFHRREKGGEWELRFEGDMGPLSEHHRRREITWENFEAELHEFLVRGPSFYNWRCSEELSQRLLESFSQSFASEDKAVLVTTPGILTRVSRFDRVGLPYFDGRGRDRLYLWKAGSETWALLLNGKECRNRRVTRLFDVWESSAPLLIADSEPGRALEDYVDDPAFMEALRENDLAQKHELFHAPEYATGVCHLGGTARSGRPLLVLGECPWSEFPTQLLNLAKEQGLAKSEEAEFRRAAEEFCASLKADDGLLRVIDRNLLYTEAEADQRGALHRLLGYFQGSTAEGCWSWKADGRNWMLFINEFSF